MESVEWSVVHGNVVGVVQRAVVVVVVVVVVSVV